MNQSPPDANVFESFARTTQSARSRSMPRRPKLLDPRKDALEKLQDDRRRLKANYTRMRTAWKEAIVDEHDPTGKLGALMSCVASMTGTEMVATVKAATWLRESHPDLRFLALVEFDALIAAIKSKAGQDAWSDPLPDLVNPESEVGLTAFWILKRLLRVR